MSVFKSWFGIAAGLAALAAVLVLLPPGSGGNESSPAADLQTERLQSQLEALQPKGLHILIDTGANRLTLKRGPEIVMEAVCSTGSRRTLVSGDRSWTFETPRGVRQVRAKVRNPVWRRPDWAFLEEGKPVPRREGDRYQAGVLGDYAFDIGNGYFIHGTLYSRLLGQNVTHGCVRLGDDDLKRLFDLVPVGARVYVF